MEHSAEEGYLIEAACITRDGFRLVIDMNINLTKAKTTVSQSWLDNCYRPEVERHVQAFIATCDHAEVSQRSERIMEHLKKISQEVFNHVPAPQ